MSRISEEVVTPLAARWRWTSNWKTGSDHPKTSGGSTVKRVRFGRIESPLEAVLTRWVDPLVIVISLFLCLKANDIALDTRYCALAIVALLLSAQIFTPAAASQRNSMRFLHVLRARRLAEWMLVLAALLLLGFLLKLQDLLTRALVLNWFASAALLLIAANVFGSRLLNRFTASQPNTARHIIIGANDVGLELTRRIRQRAGVDQFLGFFDFRSPERLSDPMRSQLLGHCSDVANYVRANSISTVYIALPISPAPRIAQLLQELRDTTASVYFVPDIFAFDLVQARYFDIDGIPAVAICDSPLHGMSGICKRAIDVALAVIALTALWPLLTAISIAVRLSSPGPVLFKQKRYGLNGEEISVYKFRSMTVCEDGPVVTQATKNDQRITPVGRFLRKTSLDELPQIINVLEGKMSFVGPRPHAVAHNEQYRKLISGYMIRHKVRPGITGWAQVNGLRGETDTIEKMKLRVQYDLDYLRSWSLWLDIKIICKTALAIFRDQNAY